MLYSAQFGVALPCTWGCCMCCNGITGLMCIGIVHCIQLPPRYPILCLSMLVIMLVHCTPNSLPTGVMCVSAGCWRGKCHKWVTGSRCHGKGSYGAALWWMCTDAGLASFCRWIGMAILLGSAKQSSGMMVCGGPSQKGPPVWAPKHFAQHTT